MAISVAVVAVLLSRWAAVLPGFRLERSTRDLSRFAPLTPYLTVQQGVTSITTDGRVTAWSNPFDRPRHGADLGGVAAGRAERVSAILVSQERRFAIIGDRILSVGDTLASSGRVEAIEADHVVVNRGGRRQVLKLVLQRSLR